jgi:hypothetical protein
VTVKRDLAELNDDEKRLSAEVKALALELVASLITRS